MNKIAASSESGTSSSAEISKSDLANEVRHKLTSDKGACEAILNQVKWSLDIRNQNGKIPWNSQLIRNKLSGKLIGSVAEAVDERVSLMDAETVFNPKNISLEDLKVVSPQVFSGATTNRKADVFSRLLRKSFEEKPLAAFNPQKRIKNNPLIDKFKEERAFFKAPQVPPQEYTSLLREYMIEAKEKIEDEFVQGYAHHPEGEFYASTVIPDGLVVKGDNLIGMFEVKAVKAEELDRAMTIIRSNKKRGGRETSVVGTAADFGHTYPGADKEQYRMGVDLDKEAEFVDILQGLTGKGENLGVNNLIILRFPDDIPDNLLNQYGEMIVSCGYTNVVIQKLPFSREELNVIAKEVVKSRWQSLYAQLSGNKNFSLRDLNVLGEYAGIEK